MGETGRETPLFVLASSDSGRAEALASALGRAHPKAVVYVVRSFDGCLRVATAVGPDAIVLDRGAPCRLEQLLRAHPASARARILRVSDLALQGDCDLVLDGRDARR